MRFNFLALLFASSTLALFAQAPAPTDYQLQMHVKIPMRDGIHFNATLFSPVPVSPATTNPPLPVIFILSPLPRRPAPSATPPPPAKPPPTGNSTQITSLLASIHNPKLLGSIIPISLETANSLPC
jgi:hypothetical protein